MLYAYSTVCDPQKTSTSVEHLPKSEKIIDLERKYLPPGAMLSTVNASHSQIPVCRAVRTRPLPPLIYEGGAPQAKRSGAGGVRMTWHLPVRRTVRTRPLPPSFMRGVPHKRSAVGRGESGSFSISLFVREFVATPRRERACPFRRKSYTICGKWCVFCVLSVASTPERACPFPTWRCMHLPAKQ